MWTHWHDWFGTLFGGLLVGLELAVVSFTIGLPLGFATAVGTMSSHRWQRRIAIGLVEVGRGCPALLLLYLVYYGLPDVGLTFSAFMTATGVLAFISAAYTGEVIRGALASIPRGETEASSALGMTNTDTIRFILVPQAVVVATPALLGYFVAIFQATALTSQITVRELLARAGTIGSATFEYTQVLLLAALMYLAITVPLGVGTRALETRFARHR